MIKINTCIIFYVLLSSPFDAIADFARRSTGGGGGRSRRDDSRDRDLRSDISFLNKMNKNVGVHENSIILITLNTEPKSRHEMSVPNDVVGSVIGKRGSKINEIRQIRYLRAKHDFLILGSKETFLCRSGATINIMESGQKRRERSPEPGPLVRWELSL